MPSADRVKIVLTVSLAQLIDGAAGSLAHLGGVVYNLLVEYRQCARHTGAKPGQV